MVVVIVLVVSRIAILGVVVVVLGSRGMVMGCLHPHLAHNVRVIIIPQRILTL